MMNKGNKLTLYKDDEGKVNVNVRFADEEVWLTRENLAEIYATTPQNISLHVGNIYQDKELSEEGTRKKFFLIRQEGNNTVSHQEAIEKAEREFESYREREMRQLESDFDKAVRRLRNKKDKDDKTEA